MNTFFSEVSFSLSFSSYITCIVFSNFCSRTITIIHQWKEHQYFLEVEVNRFLRTYSKSVMGTTITLGDKCNRSEFSLFNVQIYGNLMKNLLLFCNLQLTS